MENGAVVTSCVVAGSVLYSVVNVGVLSSGDSVDTCGVETGSVFICVVIYSVVTWGVVDLVVTWGVVDLVVTWGVVTVAVVTGGVVTASVDRGGVVVVAVDPVVMWLVVVTCCVVLACMGDVVLV